MTALDKAMRSKNAVLAFSGLVTGVAIWAIWGGDMFPATEDPKGAPETWTREELRRWLAAVGAQAHAMVLSFVPASEKHAHAQ
ncbi:uncharacterized protein SPSK_05693 [Sporothrix schenckii 1099-18]|uniref:STE24 endopeptidase n=1 Tax=Sporothrix schenckii 1099-18 TaxID=1397361 RepID=A0A0F2LXX3_SPOSC|nr:uncharacterized protein SPSK_05693 [Sporothrix schenckii 1099-18]KJR80746.1 hypothetical protein SPSK_05693 [Sporothrix schenckii 1099-18]